MEPGNVQMLESAARREGCYGKLMSFEQWWVIEEVRKFLPVCQHLPFTFSGRMNSTQVSHSASTPRREDLPPS